MTLYNSTKSSLGVRISGIARSSGQGIWQPYEFSMNSRFNQISQRHPGPPYKEGGPWYMERTQNVRTVGQGSGTFIQGTFCLGEPTFNLSWGSNPQLLTDGEINQFGTELFNEGAELTRPQSDVPQFAIELYRDGAPRIPGREFREEAKKYKALGSEYLNTEFGWKPFISDFRRFLRVVTQGHKLWRNYTKYANTWHPVSRSYPVDVHVVSGTGGFTVYPTAPSVAAYGNLVKKSVSRTWSKGHFRYYLPTGDSFLPTMDRYYVKAKYLLGVRIDPELLWEAAPWSWAADWFGNFGDVMKNISALGTDGLVARDAYLMHHIQKEARGTATPLANNKGLPRVPLNYYYNSEFKTRFVASPFGFNIDWPDFSARQMLIALSIGATRSPGKAKG